MITIKEGSCVWRVLTVLAISNDYPCSSIEYFGNYEIYRRLIHKMLETETYYNPLTKEKMTCKALNRSGDKSMKTIHIAKSGEPLLKWLGLYEFYQQNHTASRNETDMERCHRVAEINLFFYDRGIHGLLTADECHRYISRKDLVQSKEFYAEYGGSEEKKIMFTRVIGFVNTGEDFVPVYNTRNRLMKWIGESEYKVKGLTGNLNLSKYGNMNSDRIFLFGTEYDVGYRLINSESNADVRKKLMLRGVYSKIQFIPFDEFGKKLYRVIEKESTTAELKQLILGNSDKELTKVFEYDMKKDGKYHYSFLDSDMARYSKFLKQKKVWEGKAIVYCYEEQLDFVRETTGGKGVSVVKVNIDDVLSELGL